MLSVRRVLGRDIEPTAAGDPERPRGVAAPLAVPDRDADSLVGVDAEPTGTGICARCWRGGSRSPPARGRQKTRRRSHATGRMLFGDGAVGVGGSQQRHAHRRPTNPAPAARALEEILRTAGAGMTGGASHMTLPAGDDDRPLRGGARRDRARRGGQALRAHADPHHGARARPRAHRGPARPRQDADRPVVRRRARAGLHPGAVHPRSAARRPARLDDLRHAVGPLRVPPRARSSPTCCWPTRSTARRPRPRRRCWRRWPRARSASTASPTAARAVHRAGHRQPDRVRGHLSAAGGAAGPVRDPARTAVPVRAGRDVDAAPPPRTRFGRADGAIRSWTRTICWPCANRSSR